MAPAGRRLVHDRRADVGLHALIRRPSDPVDAGGPIKAELDVSDTQIGLLQGFAFAVFYTLVGIPLGRLADRTDRRRRMAWGIFIWSLATAICGFARTYAQLFAARVGVGVGEAALSPAAYSLLADSFPASQRGRALGVYSMGVYLGIGLVTAGDGCSPACKVEAGPGPDPDPPGGGGCCQSSQEGSIGSLLLAGAVALALRRRRSRRHHIYRGASFGEGEHGEGPPAAWPPPRAVRGVHHEGPPVRAPGRGRRAGEVTMRATAGPSMRR